MLGFWGGRAVSGMLLAGRLKQQIPCGNDRQKGKGNDKGNDKSNGKGKDKGKGKSKDKDKGNGKSKGNRKSKDRLAFVVPTLATKTKTSLGWGTHFGGGDGKALGGGLVASGMCLTCFPNSKRR